MNVNVAIGENVTKGKSLGTGNLTALRSDREKTEGDRECMGEEGELCIDYAKLAMTWLFLV